MRHIFKRLRDDSKGSAVLELTLGIIPILLLLMTIAEVSRFIYISNILDLAISNAAKKAKNTKASNQSDYHQIFAESLNQQIGSFGYLITTNNNFILEVQFSDSLSDLIADNYHNAGDHPIGKYRLNYSYQPIFIPISSAWANSLLSREVIFVQEYERSLFET
ncbi:tadE-like family protein [Yersinia ruckeri]|uniref:TadE/TadG family type IV pilus assembly protein n=1 Tax=Yersinia ruckeri TaxID=29486 RepID=UPI0005ACA1C6|nr:TadE/TadG family type IV pilus assembly protein [Yersinia ruckeri]AJI94107.1 tadE-like family protein [Yersinia ruckeri]MCW6567517.1 pilus assembly protein [Yersinia ruckeri]